MDERVPLTPLLSLLPYAITIFALSLPSPSFPLRLSIFLLNVSITLYIITSTTLPLASFNFSQGASLAAQLFAMSDFVLVSDVHAELKRIGQTREGGEWEKMGVWERVKWGVSLVTSPRLIGWSSSSISTRNNTTSPSLNTTIFILRQSLHLLLELLTLVALIALSANIPEFSSTGRTLANAPWHLRSLYTILLGIAMYASIDVSHKLWMLGLLVIGNPIIVLVRGVRRRLAMIEHQGEGKGGKDREGEMKSWQPTDFPPLFGDWADAWTLRRFWGKTWQQTHRRKFKSHSRFIKSLLPLLPLFTPLSPSLSRTTDLYTAFLISGIMHAAGEYMCFSSSASVSSRQQPLQYPQEGGWGWGVGGSLRFFMIQALAVHVETLVLGALAKTNFLTFTPTPTSAGGHSSSPTDGPTCPTNQITNQMKKNQVNPTRWPWLNPTCWTKLFKLLGYIWVWQWFTYSTPILFDPLVKRGGFLDDLRVLFFSFRLWGVNNTVGL